MGVITGDILVAGEQRDDSFQRSTGYVQQQDLHLETATCREALTFSALLRQPRSVPKEEKLAYVEEIIKLLEMDSYADAVVGKTGEGLNVEQRKRLSIGVEMVAKPELLLFLDEPSRCVFVIPPSTRVSRLLTLAPSLRSVSLSGLDSQTSWSILNLLETLKNHGQAVLCTSGSACLASAPCIASDSSHLQSTSRARCSSRASTGCSSSLEEGAQSTSARLGARARSSGPTSRGTAPSSARATPTVRRPCCPSFGPHDAHASFFCVSAAEWMLEVRFILIRPHALR